METVIELDSIIELTDEQFFLLCQRNRDYKFERNARGDLVVMSPTGGETSKRNSDLIIQLGIWNKKYKLGVIFDSSGGFKLPLGGDRSPDASWIKKERWDNLTPQQRAKFLPLCPDFLIELRSPTDSLSKIQEKMKEYMANGCQLGWLIEPENKQVEIYRQGKEVEIVKNIMTLSGEDVLPEFTLDLSEIW
jgi:Uma2 family endonuclease